MSLLNDKFIRKYQNDLYLYNKHVYKKLTDDDLHFMLLHEYDNLLTHNHRCEIVKFIKSYLENEIIDKTFSYLINTPTKIINLKTLKIEENTPYIFNIKYVNFDYDRNIKSDFIIEYLKSIFDDDDIIVILQMLGYCMLGDLRYRKAFYLIGDAKKGKSFFVDLIRIMFDYDQVSNIDPASIDLDQFAVGDLHNKLVNIADDIEDIQIKNTGVLKKLFSGDVVNANKKFADRINFKSFATFILTANTIPKFKERNDAIYSRLIFIYFNKLPKTDTMLLNKFDENAFIHLVTLSINAVNKTLKNGAFLLPKKHTEQLKSYKLESSIVHEFVLEVYTDYKNLNRKSVTVVFKKYQIWCEENSTKSFSRKFFLLNISSTYNIGVKQTTSSIDNFGNVKRFVLIGDKKC